jgi:hypothetical protein
MIAVAILWLLLGLAAVAFTGRQMGYLRWSDLFLIAFGVFWVATPYWRDEDGKRIWERKP